MIVIEKHLMPNLVYDPEKNLVELETTELFLIDSKEKVDLLVSLLWREFARAGQKFYLVVNLANFGLSPKIEVARYLSQRLEFVIGNQLINVAYFGSERNFLTSTLMYLSVQMGLKTRIYSSREEALNEVSKEKFQPLPVFGSLPAM